MTLSGRQGPEPAEAHPASARWACSASAVPSGGTTPVHSSSWARPWKTSIHSPSMGRAEAARASRSSRVRSGRYTMSITVSDRCSTQPSGRAEAERSPPSGIAGRPGPPGSPGEARRSRGAPAPAPAGSGGAPCHRTGRRGTQHGRLAGGDGQGGGSGPRRGDRGRPGCAPGAEDRGPGPRAGGRGVLQRPLDAQRRRCCAPPPAPAGVRWRQLAAPASTAREVRPSARASAASLCGAVTETPIPAPGAERLDDAGQLRSGDPNRLRRTSSRPRRSASQENIRGEAEWATGSPMTAQRSIGRPFYPGDRPPVAVLTPADCRRR